MHRRHFLHASAALISSAALPASATTTEVPFRHVGTAQAFDYAALKGQARALATAPYKPNTSPLPPAIAALDWDQWQSIRFRDAHSLWAGGGLRFQARFAHLGYRLEEPVRIYQVEDGRARELA